ncbi:ATPase type 13A2 isoform 3, variant [Capsaspora owczarzaki ATCC 30864]|nr:ATPase type 13A2 isoform 3, variant [Capsaspora owczarzaki ATCC 30864]
MLGLVLYYFAGFATVGITTLFFRWYPVLRLKLTHRRCKYFDQADSVLVDNIENGWSVEEMLSIDLDQAIMTDLMSASTPHRQDDLHSLDSYHDSEPILMSRRNDSVKPPVSLKYFSHRMVRYVLDKQSGEFNRMSGLSSDDFETLPEHVTRGLDASTHARRIAIFGPNQIDVQVKSYVRLLFEEVLNPFYIFQLFSVLVWIGIAYYYYAACIIVVSGVSIAISLVETKTNQRNLRNMALFHEKLTVVRNGSTFEVPSDDLAPGDLLVIPAEGLVLSCDAVLLSGKCIVNESMLTGESVPVTKSPLPLQDEELRPPKYNPDGDKKHTLYCGTRVIQTRQPAGSRVLAMVVRTGFYTAKGFLIRSILYPKPSKFRFYSEAMRFVLFLFLLAMAGFAYSLVVFVNRHIGPADAILKALDLITVVVPPALPAAMTIGTVFAIARLKKGLVYCISPPRVNVCGKIKMMCFDKTGTLTEDGLDVWGFVPITSEKTHDPVPDLSTLPLDRGLYALATCHSLTTVNNEMIGDPVDLKMFLATKWLLEEPGEETERYDSMMPTLVRPAGTVSSTMKPTADNYLSSSPHEIGIVRQFHFSSHLQRMSVIVNHLEQREMAVYVKGSPEMLRELCNPASIPADYNEKLSAYTHQGYRVLAIGYRSLPKYNWLKAQRVTREEVESDLTMLGLLIMQNRLKPETTPVIDQLLDANIRCAMVTGDNPLTAVSVARECHLINNDSIVFLGDLSQGRVFWSHLDDPTWQLDPATLVPFRTVDPFAESQTSSHGARVASPFEMNFTPRSKVNASSYARMTDEAGKATCPPYTLAITGKAFEVLKKNYSDNFLRLLVRGVVFARMSPEHKTQLVESLQDIGYVVGFCGDGANDCGALKAGHIGVSLSEAEASVAAPFTYRRQTIECIPFVIREGRGALMTSFSMFKFMALYSFIQFTTVLILRYIGSNLGDQQYLYFDLFMILILAVVMGRTGPAEKLGVLRPPGSLISPTIMSSLCLHIILVVVVQASAYIWLQHQSWFVPVVVPNNVANEVDCTENTLLFYISAFQYLITAVVFSIGAPFRKSMFTNYWFMAALSMILFVTLYLTINPPSWAASDSFLQLLPLPTSARVAVAVFDSAHLVIAYALELFLATVAAKRVFRVILRKKRHRNRYKHIAKHMMDDYTAAAAAHGAVRSESRL